MGQLAAVLERGVAEAAPDQMDYAGLNCGGRKDRVHRIGQALRPSHAVGKMPLTPRDLRSLTAAYQNLAGSSSPSHKPSTSLYPAKSTPMAAQAARFCTCASRTSTMMASMNTAA